MRREKLAHGTPLSIKEQLRSGEMQVRGDNWPNFLYPDNAFDPDDPLTGLLRSPLLVTVSFYLWALPYSFLMN